MVSETTCSKSIYMHTVKKQVNKCTICMSHMLSRCAEKLVILSWFFMK